MTESLSHFGPWTTADLAGLPDDGQRYEIIDGSLLVTPAPAPRHQLVAGRISVFLRESAPDEADVVEATNFQLTTGRLLVPDVIVAQSSALLTDSVALVPADVHLVVEVVSPSNAAMDRIFKPQLYAAAGIQWMWRVEFGPDGPEIVVLDLRSGSPVVHARSTDVLRVDLPFTVEVPVNRLLATRQSLKADESAQADLES
ncbi:Uma2 family endonuclease [Kribbella soli]|uniref:Uma2 family endonuclease n=1 Tax=Kribbella soli TaxID=1124743 RepID=A0A4R0HQZ2_9ACTN|nr:Uma2 family endonuclease [Kribbella soli]TCC11742.1 Uma2 family endonuclease [Kribbella soli]